MAKHPLGKLKRETAMAAATPRGHNDELFPVLPALSASVQIGFSDSPWKKIHEAREHSNIDRHSTAVTDNSAARTKSLSLSAQRYHDQVTHSVFHSSRAGREK